MAKKNRDSVVFVCEKDPELGQRQRQWIYRNAVGWFKNVKPSAVTCYEDGIRFGRTWRFTGFQAKKTARSYNQEFYSYFA